MHANVTRRRFLARLGSLLSVTTVGCGTVLHPERRGQSAGPLDWKIVALDAVGLLFFFVPGVVAFAVDFSNGTIYLPSDQYGSNGSQSGPVALQEIKLPDGETTHERIEQAVSAHLGRPIQLAPNEFRTRELQNIDEFWQADRSFRDA